MNVSQTSSATTRDKSDIFEMIVDAIESYIPPREFSTFWKTFCGHKLNTLKMVAHMAPDMLCEGTLAGCPLDNDVPAADEDRFNVHPACQCAFRGPFDSSTVEAPWKGWAKILRSSMLGRLGNGWAKRVPRTFCMPRWVLDAGPLALLGQHVIQYDIPGGWGADLCREIRAQRRYPPHRSCKRTRK